MSPSRRAVLAVGALGLSVVAVVVLLRTAAGETDVSVLLLVGLVEVLIVLVGYAVLLLRRTSGATRRSMSRIDKRVKSVAQLAPTVRETRAIARRVDTRTERTIERLRRMDSNDGRVLRGRGEYAQVEALLELRALAGADDIGLPMPALRGWAASPTTLLAVMRAVLDERPELVVECGSGSSSVWVGHLLRRLGHGRYVALEHEEAYAGVSRAEVERHGLSDVVEVRHAPLVPVDVDGEQHLWYDPAVFADLRGIGVVFVDGPPAATGPRARVPAVPLLAPHARPGAVFVLDDAARPEEREVVADWTRRGATVLLDSRVEKGVTVLRVGEPAAAPPPSRPAAEDVVAPGPADA